ATGPPFEGIPRAPLPTPKNRISSGDDEFRFLRQRLDRTAQAAEHRRLERWPAGRIVRLPKRRSRHRGFGEHLGNRIQLRGDERRSALANWLRFAWAGPNRPR